MVNGLSYESHVRQIIISIGYGHLWNQVGWMTLLHGVLAIIMVIVGVR